MEIAEPHLAGRADQQIGLGKSRGAEPAGDHRLIDRQAGKTSIQTGLQSMMDFTASTSSLRALQLICKYSWSMLWLRAVARCLADRSSS